jgi:two-component system CheB/CheR fusion protein
MLPNDPMYPAVSQSENVTLPNETAGQGKQTIAVGLIRPQDFPIVGIGASAGGLKALLELLGKLPTGIGMSFVVIQHLDPHHHSQLPALLQKKCRLPVAEAVDGTELRPSCVYVITPNSYLVIEHGILHVKPREFNMGGHQSIDILLQSLAADQPGNSIGVILSGTGSDGTRGLTAIKAARGITFAQDSTADYPGMPQNAVLNGHVDFILHPTEIAKELVKISEVGFPEKLISHSVSNESELDELAVKSYVADSPRHYDSIVHSLQLASGIDVAHLRSATIISGIHRRMDLTNKTTMEEYARFLVDTPGEVDELAKDILIHATDFFREGAVFESIKNNVLPTFFDRKGADSTVRLWVVGCSTGQEVYSLAILCAEECRVRKGNHRVQIFATDISNWALTQARLGSYPESVSAEIPSELLSRYFIKDDSGYRVVKMIRDLCVFAKHDITFDTPFTRIDLVSCRNLLIDMSPILHDYILSTFHFSLKPGGILVLGKSETLGQAASLYETIDGSNRMYRTIVGIGRQRPAVPGRQTAEPIAPNLPETKIQFSSDMLQAADQIVLSRFSPPGVLINEAMEVLQYRGQKHPILEPTPGDISGNLLTMVPFGVSQAIREAVAQAKSLSHPVRRERIAYRLDQSDHLISIEVLPIKLPTIDTGYLILFEDQAGTTIDQPRSEHPGGPSVSSEGQNSDLKEKVQLRSELAAASDYIQSILGLNHSLIGRVKEAHEEAQSIAEEFKSTNEELQTAKEEVESTNEELVTINEELSYTSDEREKISEALRASSELTAAIVETMRYPLLVLTDQLHVESANQAFLDVFGFDRQVTAGQLVYNLGDGQWNIPELHRLLEEILPNSSAFDDFEVTHDFRNIGRKTMLMNARLLKGTNDQTRRIVLVIADITERTRIALALKHASDEQLRSNAELEQFAAVAAHDLQEPLRMVSSYVGILERKYGSLFDDSAKKFMGFAVDGARRMAEMINAILAYSQLGHESTGMISVDGGQVLKGAIANLELRITEAQAVIIADELPRLTANPEQLMQLFQNLISNAVKFHHLARIPRVHISARESEHEWTIAIADNGMGMREADFQKIFLPYQRAKTEHYVKGCGIGLATCKKIIDHHKGQIWVTSQIDVGSTFSFTIPK